MGNCLVRAAALLLLLSSCEVSVDGLCGWTLASNGAAGASSDGTFTAPADECLRIEVGPDERILRGAEPNSCDANELGTTCAVLLPGQSARIFRMVDREAEPATVFRGRVSPERPCFLTCEGI